MAFVGAGAGGQEGVYLAAADDVARVGPPIRVADQTTAIPGGTGRFTSFSDPAIAVALTGPPIRVAFFGAGVGGQAGVYLAAADDVAVHGPPIRVADQTTAIPGGTGSFTSFSDPSIAAAATGPPIRVAFVGAGASGQAGVYLAAADDVAAQGPPIRVADQTTAIPGGTGSFTSFSDLSLAVDVLGVGPPIRVAFVGSGAGQQGVYLSALDAVGMQGPPIKVADLTTAIPQGAGSFTGFTSVSTSRGHTAFLGLGTFGQVGIYLASTLSKVVAVGDILAGKTVTGLRLGRSGLNSGSLAFTATFADGSEGVFVVLGQQPFATFKANLEIEKGRRAHDDAFEIKATFTLGAGSNGLDVPTEIVSLQLTGGTGAFSTTLPAGSFKQEKNGRLKFKGMINGVKVEASIRPLRGGAFEFQAEGERANLTGMANPVTVTLTIGDDSGSATGKARFE